MHIPDGFLDAKTITVTTTLAGAGGAVALARVRRSLPPRCVPLLGLAAAFIFAAQMLNFPVIGGTSGHLVGATLAAVLLGPSAAVIVLTAVLIVQCLLFADGGVTALGANIVNMALIGGVFGYGVYRAAARLLPGAAGKIAAAAFAAWCSTVLAAVCCAGEIAASGAAPWSAVFTAMTSVHMLIGLGEAGITVLVLSSIAASRPDLLQPAAATAARSYRTFILYALLLTLALALFASPLACRWPDGLDSVSERLGFKNRAPEKPLVPSVAPDYKPAFIPNPALATSLAAAAGTVAAFGLSVALARALARRRPMPMPAAASHVPLDD